MHVMILIMLFLSCITSGLAQNRPASVPQQMARAAACPTFYDLPTEAGDEAISDYLSYRKLLQNEAYNSALKTWRKVYRVAPAANGHQSKVFTDGIFLYEKMYQQYDNPTYIDTIFLLYDALNICLPNEGEVAGRKAYDYYFKYPERVSKLEIYRLFKVAIDSGGLNTNTVFITPFAQLLIELYEAQLLPNETIKAHLQHIEKIIDYQLQQDDFSYLNHLITEQEIAKTRNYFESVAGFFDCEYFVERYYQPEDTISTDFHQLNYVLHKLAQGNCGPGHTTYDTLWVKYTALSDCHYLPPDHTISCLQNKDYSCALEELSKSIRQESDTLRKSEVLMLMAKIAYLHQQDYQQGRSYAEQVTALRPNWGAPYILIGRMYVMSDSLCTDSLDKYATIWAALDMWNKAKQTDLNYASEAQDWIEQYTQRLPTRTGISGPKLEVGDPYHIGCWIQRVTTVKFQD